MSIRIGKPLLLLLCTISVLLSTALLWGPHRPHRYNIQLGLWPTGDGEFAGHPRSLDSVYVPLHDEKIPLAESVVVKSIAGYNHIQNLYFFNDTFIFVTNDAAAAGFPEVGASYIVSGPQRLKPNGHRGGHEKPGPDRWQILTPEEARQVLGAVAIRKPGLTLYFDDRNDAGQQSVIGHYYHCELFLGAWRIAVAAGNSQLPSRVLFRATDWRDKARISPWLLHTILAGADVEEVTGLGDLKDSQTTFLYESMSIACRWAAHRHGVNVKYWNKANADLPSLKVPVDWFEPLRQRAVALAYGAGCIAKRKQAHVPVVTYINRQLTGRRMPDSDHERLIGLLEGLASDGAIEFHDAQMEKMTRPEQFCLSARTDIMLGVHGNGLSHQLWMKPGGAVLEFMKPGGFARDYGVLAEAMGHEYYAVHNATHFPRANWTRKDGWAVDQGPDFHSKNIAVYGPYVAGVVKAMAEARRNGPVPFDWEESEGVFHSHRPTSVVPVLVEQ